MKFTHFLLSATLIIIGVSLIKAPFIDSVLAGENANWLVMTDQLEMNKRVTRRFFEEVVTDGNLV